MRKRTVFISFFTSCTQPCPSDLSAHTHPLCDVCVRALWLTLHSHGASVSTLDGGRVWSVVLMQLIQAPTEASANQIASCKYPSRSLATPEKYVIGCCNYDGASAPRFRHALRQAFKFKKNDINTVRFLTQPLVSCLRPSMCSYDGELFNLDFSVHVLFPSYRDSDLYLPLYDWQTRTVWPKNIKIGSTEEKKTPTSWMPLG